MMFILFGLYMLLLAGISNYGGVMGSSREIYTGPADPNWASLQKPRPTTPPRTGSGLAVGRRLGSEPLLIWRTFGRRFVRSRRCRERAGASGADFPTHNPIHNFRGLVRLTGILAVPALF